MAGILESIGMRRRAPAMGRLGGDTSATGAYVPRPSYSGSDTSAMGAYITPQAWQAQQQNGYASRLNTGYMTGTEGVAPSPLFQQMAQQQKSMPSNWLQGGRTYAGVGRLEPGPNPNQPQAAPNFGQTAAEAQAGYLADQANTSRLTSSRIEGMLRPGGGMYIGDWTRPMEYRPTGVLAGGRQGDDSTAAVAPARLSVTPQSDGTGYSVVGDKASHLSRGQWDGARSTLPGANGRTNAEMFAQRRADMAGEKQQRKDSQALAAARMYNLDPRFAPAVYQAAKRQGIQLPGMPREKAGAGATASAQTPTLPQAISGLQEEAQNPIWNMLQPGFNPATSTPVQFTNFIATAPWDKVDTGTLEQFRSALRNARALPDFKEDSQQKQLIDAMLKGGPSAAKAIIEGRKSQLQIDRDKMDQAMPRGLFR